MWKIIDPVLEAGIRTHNLSVATARQGPRMTIVFLSNIWLDTQCIVYFTNIVVSGIFFALACWDLDHVLCFTRESKRRNRRRTVKHSSNFQIQLLNKVENKAAASSSIQLNKEVPNQAGASNEEVWHGLNNSTRNGFYHKKVKSRIKNFKLHLKAF